MENTTDKELKLLEEDEIPTVIIDLKGLEEYKRLFLEHEDLKKHDGLWDACLGQIKQFSRIQLDRRTYLMKNVWMSFRLGFMCSIFCTLGILVGSKFIPPYTTWLLFLLLGIFIRPIMYFLLTGKLK